MDRTGSQLTIIDYEAGNQTSVQRALEHIGIPCCITADAERISRAAGVIFPGVGAAGQAMGHLQRTGLDTVLKDIVAAKRPLLGICLGCQILLTTSEENNTPTLGIVEGHCRRFEDGLLDEDNTPIRIPHMGWNSLRMHCPSVLMTGIPAHAQFYFVHSYYADPPEPLRIASTFYGREFCSVYGYDGLWALQFHVEKSGEPGLRILHNFYAYCTA